SSTAAQLLSNVSPVASAAQTSATSSSVASATPTLASVAAATQKIATSSAPALQLLSNVVSAAATQTLATSNSPASQLLSNVSPPSSGPQTELAGSSSLVNPSFIAGNVQGSRSGPNASGSSGASGIALTLSSFVNSSGTTLPSVNGGSQGGSNQDAGGTTNLGSSIGGADHSGGGVAAALNSVAVPGPSIGAGLPGLIFAGGGLLAWWLRTRRAQASSEFGFRLASALT